MKILYKILKWTCITVVALVLCILLAGVAFFETVDMLEPQFTPDPGTAVVSDSIRVWKDNYAKFNKYGIVEMRISGNAFERGEAIGKLVPDLLAEQEKAFVDQLYEFVPSEFYRRFLMRFIYMFNRDLGKNVIEEYRQEIRAMSEYCTHDYDEYGTPYQRQMEYHSAHDIGHVMQDYMLVGCTAFAIWGDKSKDGELLIGRNFDFYMGDDFSSRKIVLMERPDSGYAFMSVTWPGMIGILSGMNEKGLTVTINASKLETPKMSATPISLLSREILQYASNIDEAWKIACSRRTFVSESILVGSVADNRAVIIEKTPSEISLYDTAENGDNQVICTNHYQSDLFKSRDVNMDNIRNSDSGERFLRTGFLLDSLKKIGPAEAALILRDKKGYSVPDVGYCNELTINQLIAMHSVIFRPASLQMWVSTYPWQCGEYICYDLDKMRTSEGPADADIDENTIPADEFLDTGDFAKVMEFKRMLPEIRSAAGMERVIPQDSLDYFCALNPLYFNGYNVVGDYYAASGDNESACKYWDKSLNCTMKRTERQAIENKLARIRH